MKVKVKSRFGVEKIELDLVDYVTSSIDGDDYERGALEATQATASNISILLGKLIERLVSKKELTEVDLSKFFGDQVELIHE